MYNKWLDKMILSIDGQNVKNRFQLFFNGNKKNGQLVAKRVLNGMLML